ncbi:MarR family protein [Rubripirellula lacrimiformis]|uniref:MarR family protein n=1 Tax=Rubripirellula lacrimiformis TaxID=1930273 RepID=A0A517NIE1_9BACT|nr:helix-turn-helix domain-containing protein [Rubripirellula lacrimiformis]QDT06907.1 MarR family protein [Rubripirellula lacrimiformis]
MKQQDLFTDLPRGEQLAALRRIEFATYSIGKNKVSPKMQKAVLRAIDDHEGQRECFATQETIAAEIGCSVSTVVRAIAALVDQDLITKERPNGFSPNHHRIVWTSVFMKTKQGTAPETRKASSGKTSGVERIQVEDGTLPTRTRITSNSDVEVFQRKRPINDQLTDQPTAKWQAVAATMRRWGLASAVQACKAAQDRGLALEYVAELFREAGGDRLPERWEPGQLANWLTGRTPPPFDEAEADRRREARDRAKGIEADRIRESVRRDGESRGAPEWAIAGVSFKRLREAGLERLTTDAEIQNALLLDRHERTRMPG